jgi:tetratricopeptide (TPR) repeat protein
MRKLFWTLGICLLSLPMISVGLLIAAMRSPRLDATTMKMPAGIRSAIAEGVLQNTKYSKDGIPGLRRVVLLDPNNADAWGRLCGWNVDMDAKESLATCRRAASLGNTGDDWNNLGLAQQKAGDACAAADSFTTASARTATSGIYLYVENMGRASLRCGRYYDARAGLETAIELETKSLADKDAEEDEIADYKEDQKDDREYLIVTYDKLHEAKLAAQTCSLADPEWKHCACELDEDGDASCEESR